MSYPLEGLATTADYETFAFSAENPTGTRGGGKPDHPTMKDSACVSIAPGETATLVDCEGPAELRSWWCGGYSGSDFILRVYWDGQEHPSVESPLCAFFGFPFNGVTQDHTRKFPVLNSIPVLVAAYKGLNCFWPMPFRKHCRITVTNIGKVRWPLYWMITGIRKPLPENTVYFHASYRSARPVPEQQVYTIIDGIRGQGHYVGTSLGIEVNDGACWCEGEVKMFLDGETNASLNYTGTEDYFCGSYNFGADQLRQYHDFSGPFCGMYNISYRMCRLYAPNRFMAYRWHIPDPVYFKKSFRVTVQDFGTDYSTELKESVCRKDDFVSVAYWYQTLPSQPLAPLPDYDVIKLNDIP